MRYFGVDGVKRKAECLHTDCGKEFVKVSVPKYCNDNGIEFVHGNPWSPWTQGQVPVHLMLAIWLTAPGRECEQRRGDVAGEGSVG
jgi:hypothetical protein